MQKRSVFFKLGLGALLNTLAFCSSLYAVPQIPGSFTQINMQDGGYLTGIVQHGSGRLIARTDGGGIYSSDNQGNWWTYLSSNMVTVSVLVRPGNRRAADSQLQLQPHPAGSRLCNR